MDPISQKVDELFASWDKTTSPGCALAVIKDGEIIYKRGYGMANLELGVTIRPEMIFDIGSTSKQFTALSILMLARRGQLALDDDISKYLPEIRKYDDVVTIRHMLHHISGMRDYLTLMVLAGMPFENDYQEDEVVELIARQKALNFKPGAEFLYSNSGYFLLSEIVERVSGKNLREFAEENIFKPLGMKHTHFHNDFKMIVKNRASGYSPKEDDGFEIDMGIFDVMGDGALYTSVEDLYLYDQNWYHNILDGGGQELIDQIQQIGVLNSGEKLEYAIGVFVGSYKGLKTVRHGGSWYGYRAEMLRFPEQKFSVICLCNLGTMNPSNLANKVADIYLADLLKAEQEVVVKPGEPILIELPVEDLQKIAGFYQSESGDLIQISVGKECLVLETMGQNIQLAAVEASHFVSVKSSINVDLSVSQFVDGKPQEINISIENGAMKFVARLIHPVQPTPAEMQEYAGSYRSEEVNFTHHVEIKDGILQFSGKNFPPKMIKLEFKPTLKDTFDGGMLSVHFERDDKGQVTGYLINAGRVKDIRFDRMP